MTTPKTNGLYWLLRTGLSVTPVYVFNGRYYVPRTLSGWIGKRISSLPEGEFYGPVEFNKDPFRQEQSSS